jgi:hypothetical protein
MGSLGWVADVVYALSSGTSVASRSVLELDLSFA